MGGDLGQALDGIAIVAVGGYALSVFWNGNTDKLLDALKSESRFIEFLIALALLKWAADNDFTGMVVPLLTFAGMSIALGLAGRYNISDAVRDFGSGRKSLFETLASIGR